MPNHLHGIIVIPLKQLNIENMPERFQPYMRSLQEERNPELQNYKPPTLGTIVRQYKGAATYQIHQAASKNFAWHTRYWSSILLNKAALQRARHYIYDNPHNWEKDTFYKNPQDTAKIRKTATSNHNLT